MVILEDLSLLRLLCSLLLGLITLLLYIFLHNNIHKYPKPTNISNENFPPPPGRIGWPILGETFDYISNLHKGALDKFVSDRRIKYSSEVFKTSLIGHTMVILCGAEGNKLLFSNENKLVQIWLPRSVEKIFPKSHDTPIGEDFLKVRKMLPAFLQASALQTCVGKIDQVMKKQMKKYKYCQRVKARDFTGQYTLAVSCLLLLGVNEPEKIEKLGDQVRKIASGIIALPINLPGTAFNRAVKASKAMGKELEKIIKERKVDILEERATPTQDVLSHLVLATDENGQFFKESDIASYLVGFLHAGFDPVRAAITFIIKYLAELPHLYLVVLREQMEIAEAKNEENELLNGDDMRKMKYSWNVANEVFRLMPPVLGSFREAITDFAFAGHTITKGTKIHWNSHSTHKDPKNFKNPEQFDPSRFQGNGPPPYAFVPFGGGPRMCPGNEYTRLVILVFMHNIVTKFRWELLVPNERVVFDPHPRPTQGLPILLHPHNPTQPNPTHELI